MLVAGKDICLGCGVAKSGLVSQLAGQDTQAGTVHVVRRQASGAKGCRQRRASHLCKGHFYVETGQKGLHRVPETPNEVRHCEALEAPFVTQNAGEQSLVLPGPLAVDRVVGAHHRIGPSLDHCPKGRQVDFVQRLVIGKDVYKETRIFDSVEGIVLHTGHDVVANAPCERCPQQTHVDRVLAVAFLCAAPSGVTDYVGNHASKEIGSLGSGL